MVVTHSLSKRLVDGDTAPQFEFVGPTGVAYKSAEIFQSGPALLTFYRGGVVHVLPGRPARPRPHNA
jgi:hypothetical protein